MDELNPNTTLLDALQHENTNGSRSGHGSVTLPPHRQMTNDRNLSPMGSFIHIHVLGCERVPYLILGPLFVLFVLEWNDAISINTQCGHLLSAPA